MRMNLTEKWLWKASQKYCKHPTDHKSVMLLKLSEMNLLIVFWQLFTNKRAMTILSSMDLEQS